ncbi:MAG: ABC transporter ATP-binding protein/permease [Oscillospiraceae bacterium]|jgi:ABC-type multidrug transport system fused ATPase/permease subunit|nr:ABC transporter ATP-binding protein/permease [Oscillospiraceae bacterium]
MNKRKTKFTRYLFALLREYKKEECYGVVMTVFCSFSVFVTPYLSKHLIDNVAKFKSTAEMYPSMLIFLAVCLLQPIFNYLRDYFFMYISENIKFDVRSRLFLRVINSPLCFFDKTTKGDIISRIANDGGSLSSFITSFWAVVVNNAVCVLMSIVGMFLLSPSIAFVLTLYIMIYTVFNVCVGEKFEKISSESLSLNDRFYTTIEQNIDNIELIKAFVAEKRVSSQYLCTLKKLFNLGIRNAKLASLCNGVSNTIVIFAIATIYCLGFGGVLNGWMTIGSVVALEVYFQMLLGPIHELINSNMAYRQFIPVLKRLHEYFELPAEGMVPSKNAQKTKKTPSVVFKNVTFGYDGQQGILDNFSFDFCGVGLYGIIGPSGIGKSTIAKLMMGFYEPCGGEVLVRPGESLATSLCDLRLNISFVSQSTQLFNVSVRENLLLGHQHQNDISDAKLIAVCKRLNLHSKIESLPDKYDTIINEKINLSGGEMQRLAIVRAYLKDAPINIFDEITSSLDDANSQDVMEIINEMKQKSVVILLTHKLKMLEGAKKVIKLGG